MADKDSAKRGINGTFVMIGVVAVVGVAAMIWGANQSREEAPKAQAAVQTEARTRARDFMARFREEPPPATAPWRVDAYRDEMRRLDVVTVCTPAAQQTGNTPAMLCFGRGVDGEEIYLESPSRFTCGAECDVAARFGEGDVIEVKAHSQAGRLRFNDYDAMSRAIRGSQVVFIEARSSVTGMQQMRFDTSNLTWPPA